VILAVQAAKLYADGDLAAAKEALNEAKGLLESEQAVHQPRQGVSVTVKKSFHPGNGDNIR